MSDKKLLNKVYGKVHRDWIKYYNTPIVGRFIKKLKEQMGRWYNPIITSTINGQCARIFFSTMLPLYMHLFPNYDRQIGKICRILLKKVSSGIYNSVVRREWGGIGIVDIGANIGDTVINIGLKSEAKYLCIEGVASYADLIGSNLQEFDYQLKRCFLSDRAGNECGKVTLEHGTAHLKKELDDTRERVSLIAFDELIESEYKDFIIDVIKVDTDGYDFKILRGAERTIKKFLPIIFFEWDKNYLMEQGEDPISIFEILFSWGYQRAVLYDNFGNLLTIINTDDQESLQVTIDYSVNSENLLYYDVLLLPDGFPITIEELY